MRETDKESSVHDLRMTYTSQKNQTQKRTLRGITAILLPIVHQRLAFCNLGEFSMLSILTSGVSYIIGTC